MNSLPTTPLDVLRDRIKDLNTKAYYLLVGLSFVYRTNPALSLKCALTLTAIVAVLPVQDYIKAEMALEVIRFLKVLSLFTALILTIVWIWTAPSPVKLAQ